MSQIFRQQLVLVWQVSNGRTVTQFIPTIANPVPVFGSIANIATTAQALSDAGLLAAYLEPVQVYTPHPVSGQPYNSEFDRARFQLKTATSNRPVNIIAPKAHIFKSDGKTVDLSRTDVQDFIAAVQANASDSGGSALSTLLFARRTKLTDPSEAA